MSFLPHYYKWRICVIMTSLFPFIAVTLGVSIKIPSLHIITIITYYYVIRIGVSTTCRWTWKQADADFLSCLWDWIFAITFCWLIEESLDDSRDLPERLCAAHLQKPSFNYEEASDSAAYTVKENPCKKSIPWFSVVILRFLAFVFLSFLVLQYVFAMESHILICSHELKHSIQ